MNVLETIRKALEGEEIPLLVLVYSKKGARPDEIAWALKHAGAGGDTVTYRVVFPVGVFQYGFYSAMREDFYLSCLDMGKREERTFKLGRVLSVEVLGKKFPKIAFDEAEAASKFKASCDALYAAGSRK